MADSRAQRRHSLEAAAAARTDHSRQLRGMLEFSREENEWRRLFGEVFGTFLLVLVSVGGGLVNARFGGDVISQSAQVIAPGLVVMCVIMFIGPLSGAHLNPGVSLAFAIRGDFPWKRVPGYLVAQFAGAVVATLLLVALLGRQDSAGLTLPGPGIAPMTALLWEAVLTTGLVSVILGTASGAQAIGWGAAVGVGGYVALAGMFGAPVSGASMNTARSIGPALVLGDYTAWWAYVAGPLVGAVIAVAFAYVLRGPGGGAAARRAASGTLSLRTSGAARGNAVGPTPPAG